MRNVYVSKDNGETSEIDVLFVTRKGIFVIESKNYSGWMFGNEADQSWTVSLPNGQKHRFYNPISRTARWRDTSATVLRCSPSSSSRSCELKKVTVESSDASVVKRGRFYTSMCLIWDNAEDVIDAEGVESLYERLRVLTDVDKAVKRAHVVNIHERYTDRKPVASSSACPRCGADLVLRTAKKGPNTGNQFYGCSNYPKCRYTREAQRVLCRPSDADKRQDCANGLISLVVHLNVELHEPIRESVCCCCINQNQGETLVML